MMITWSILAFGILWTALMSAELDPRVVGPFGLGLRLVWTNRLFLGFAKTLSPLLFVIAEWQLFSHSVVSGVLGLAAIIVGKIIVTPLIVRKYLLNNEPFQRTELLLKIHDQIANNLNNHRKAVALVSSMRDLPECELLQDPRVLTRNILQENSEKLKISNEEIQDTIDEYWNENDMFDLEQRIANLAYDRGARINPR